MRDFVPFTGSASGKARNSGVISCGITACAPADAALGCANAMVNVKLNNQTFFVNDNVTFPNAVQNTSMYTTASAMGEDVVNPYFSSTPTHGYVLANAGAEQFTVNATNGNIMTTIAAPGINGYAGSTGFHAANKSGLPKPQYIPCISPWLKDIAAVKTYITEAQSCFGTYLPASEAQSRRCWNNTRTKALGQGAGGDAYLNAGTTSFAIRDIQYIGEQVQLDDVVTSAIIQSAASSEIVVWTRGYRSFEASCDQNAQQNIILPIQIGQAEALYLVFRPSVITTSPDYYSNSFCNPFTGLSYTDNVLADVGGTYELVSSMDTASSGQFSYQLFSGTKQYPLQPIQTVSEMITEREKSTHSLHNWDWCATENMQLFKWGRKFGAKSNTSVLDFNPFQDFGYFTTFVSIYALDDQTITQNPYMAIAETNDAVTPADTVAANGTRVRGVRFPTSNTQGADSTGQVFSGVLNKFIPPIGSFYLGWDFESWTNHQVRGLCPPMTPLFCGAKR